MLSIEGDTDLGVWFILLHYCEDFCLRFEPQPEKAYLVLHVFLPFFSSEASLSDGYLLLRPIERMVDLGEGGRSGMVVLVSPNS